MWNIITSSIKNIKQPFQKIMFFGTGVVSGGYFNKWYSGKSESLEITSETSNDIDKTNGTWISTSTRFGPPHTRFISDEDFQGFFEYYIKHSFAIDYAVLKKAINIDHNNLKLFKTDQKTMFFDKLAVNKNIEALRFCEPDQDGNYKNHDFAFDKYGKAIYQYVSEP
jgi:hypothetical protein